MRIPPKLEATRNNLSILGKSDKKLSFRESVAGMSSELSTAIMGNDLPRDRPLAEAVEWLEYFLNELASIRYIFGTWGWYMVSYVLDRAGSEAGLRLVVEWIKDRRAYRTHIVFFKHRRK